MKYSVSSIRPVLSGHANMQLILGYLPDARRDATAGIRTRVIDLEGQSPTRLDYGRKCTYIIKALVFNRFANA